MGRDGEVSYLIAAADVAIRRMCDGAIERLAAPVAPPRAFWIPCDLLHARRDATQRARDVPSGPATRRAMASVMCRVRRREFISEF